MPSSACTNLDGRVAVAQIRCHANNIGDIIQRQLGHELVHLEQQRQGLADASSGTQQCHLAGLDGHGPAAAGLASRSADGRRPDGAPAHAGAWDEGGQRQHRESGKDLGYREVRAERAGSTPATRLEDRDCMIRLVEQLACRMEDTGLGRAPHYAVCPAKR